MEFIRTVGRHSAIVSGAGDSQQVLTVKRKSHVLVLARKVFCRVLRRHLGLKANRRRIHAYEIQTEEPLTLPPIGYMRIAAMLARDHAGLIVICHQPGTEELENAVSEAVRRDWAGPQGVCVHERMLSVTQTTKARMTFGAYKGQKILDVAATPRGRESWSTWSTSRPGGICFSTASGKFCK